MNSNLASFTDVLVDEICSSQPLSLSPSVDGRPSTVNNNFNKDARVIERPPKGTGQRGQFRSTEEIDLKYRDVFSYPYFNLVQSSVIDDALYSDKSIVVCAPTGSGKTVVFEMAIVQLLMELEEKQYTDDFKIIYMAPVKALCTERLTEWYSKFTRLGLLCIEVTGDTDVDFTQLKPYKIIITTPEKWDMLTRRWRDHRGLVEVIKLFLIDEVHILNDETRGPVLEAVVSRMKTIESSAQSVHRIEQLQKEIQGHTISNKSAPRIRFVAVSATVSNPEDVANWLGTSDKPAVFYKFGDECRPVKLKRIVEGYPCAEGTSIFKFDIILNYKLWPIIQKYHCGKPTLIFCNTRKSVVLTAETLSRELTITFNAEQKAKLTAVASSIKNKKLQALILSGVGCHHAGLLYEERQNIEFAFRNRDLPILITTTTLAMGVNLPAHLVIVKNTQQYVNGAYQEYSISTVLQMVGRAGRPQFDTEATAVIMTRLVDKPRYQSLVGGCEPLQSYLHKRLAENLNSEAALGTVGDVAQCVQWLRSTFLYVRAAQDPKKYLGLPQNSPQHLISKKIEELCVKAMNGLASSGLITMDEASCIESTEAGRLMSIFYLDLETMKQIMKIEGTESLERLLVLICESHELADMHLRVDERRCLNLLNRNSAAATIRFPMKGKISTRQMKLNCIIQAVLGCLSIPDPSLNQEAMKIMRIADRVCKCLVTYVTRPDLISQQPQFFSAVLNAIILAKCVTAHLWENSPFVSKQLKGIGPTFSTLLASAGKVNFMLLEESHPRDLERIMNKGPPAGNVLRKQIGLLPKYQLTMIPIDEKTVTVRLVLLNQSYLAENIENLTAGDSHKSYVIVGDSNNNLLLLVAFKDRALISVFDGTINHEVRRKHNFAHKIFAHCVSSSFVGIDVHAEYLFNDLEPFLGGSAPCIATPSNTIPTKKTAERQTCITDTYKERKRKINSDAIEKSKEKRKRENALIENFKFLKQSFETASKNLNQNMYKQNEDNINKNIDACSLSSNSTPSVVNTNLAKVKLNDVPDPCYEDMDNYEFIDEEKIDSILNEIENEMSRSKASSGNAKSLTNNLYFRDKNLNGHNNYSTKLTANCLNNISAQNSVTNLSSYKTVPKKPKPKTPKSNYTFIELLERKLSLSDDEDKTEVPDKNNGFSDTIKSQIQKYLTKTQTKTSVSDRNIKMLLDKPENNDEKTQVIKPINQDSELFNSPKRSPCPRYEIKEILSSHNFVEQNSNKQNTKSEENLIISPYSKDCDSTTSVNNVEKQHKNNEVNTSHSNAKIKALTPLHKLHNIILDNEDSKNNYDNEMNDDNLDDTLILNFYDNKNYNSDDIICVEEYNFKKDNGYHDNVPNLEQDVIMISPTEVNKKFSNTKHTDMNDHCSYLNDNNLPKKTQIHNVVLDKQNFQNLDYSAMTDTTIKNSCTDIVLENKNQQIGYNRLPYDKTFAIRDIRRDLDESTKVDTFTFVPCSDIVLKNKSLVLLNNRSAIDKILETEASGQEPYESTKEDALAIMLYADIDLTNRNQYVEDNGASNDKILTMKNIGPKTRSNQAHTNRSICYPSVSYDRHVFSESINNNQNVSINYSTNIEENEQKPEYVKRYTYSASKLDVCTKQTPEYCVQVIKKVKMDLDITAIMSRRRNSSQSYNSDCEESSNNNKRMKSIEFAEQHNTYQNTTEEANENIATDNNKNILEVSLPLDKLSRTESSTFQNAAKLPNKAKDEEKIESNNLQIINKRKEDISLDSMINKKHTNYYDDKQFLKIRNEELDTQGIHNDNYESTSGKSRRETEYANSPANGDDKIRNILHKYSKILAKNAVRTATTSCFSNNQSVGCKNSTTIKSQKPFKITDIHKLHATIPQTIVNSTPEIEKDVPKFPKVNRHVEAKNEREYLNSSVYTQCTEIRPIEDIPEYESVNDLDIEPIFLPANVDLEPSKDYNIDQSMFDPKTLLQCVSADDESDEIVPPPPEFCDGFTYFAGCDKDEALMADDQVSEGTHLNIFTEKDIAYNESIFDDCFATNLTPSTEIETWNLSQEDSWEPSNVINSSPAQSFTVVRKNTNLENNFTSRHGKLGKFRYREKSKLKIRK